jgi:NTP pyrophosphatase (non-canonical NTP hydrolase)
MSKTVEQLEQQVIELSKKSNNEVNSHYNDLFDIEKFIDNSTSNPRINSNGFVSEQGIHAVMGMQSEAGELLDATKKSIFYGKDLDSKNLIEEIGDFNWYLSTLCDDMNFDMESALRDYINDILRADL